MGLRQLRAEGQRRLKLLEPKSYFEVAETFGYVRPYPNAKQLPSNLVRRNTRTDLASVPRLLHGVVGAYGTHTLCALLHDVHCDVAEAQTPRARTRQLRREADGLFRRTLRDHAGFGIASRWMMWSAVRVFAFNRVRWPLVLALLAWGFAAAGAEISVLGQPLNYVTGALFIVGVASAATETSDGAVPGAERGSDKLTWRPIAVLSLLGAATIAAVAALPVLLVGLAALIVVLILFLLDLLLGLLHLFVVRPLIWVWRLFNYPLAAKLLSTSPGDDDVQASVDHAAAEPLLPTLHVPFR